MTGVLLAVLAALCCTAGGTVSTGPLAIEHPLTDFSHEAIGLRNPAPRFTWGLEGREAPTRPWTEVRVGTVPAADDVWTTRTDDLFACTYAGPALTPGRPYYWQVRLVDAQGAAVTDWTAPTKFIVALQDDAAWEGAQWIGERREDLPGFGDGKLVFAYRQIAGNATGETPVAPGWGPTVRVRTDEKGEGGYAFTAPSVADTNAVNTVEIALKGTTVTTSFNGKLVEKRDGVAVSAFNYSVEEPAEKAVRFVSFRLADAEGTVLVDDHYKGHLQPSFPREQKKVRVAKGLWRSWRTDVEKHDVTRFRKRFAVARKPVAYATASVFARGFYELSVNGSAADPRRVMAPAVLCARGSAFDTYDVTALLKAGAGNEIGIRLASGYSDSFSLFGPRRFDARRLIAQLRVAYADGMSETVVTDGTWEWTPTCRVKYADIYQGETVDARVDEGAAAWLPVRILPPPEKYRRLLANDQPPVRLLDPRRPVAITEPKPGVFVVDFGQNRASVNEIRLKGPKPGWKITLRHSELLGEDGMIDPWTYREAANTDTFVLAATGEVETFLPRFTYHGHRYVEVTGWPGKLRPENILNWAVHADFEETSTFDSSDATLNAIHSAAKWSLLSNLQGYLSDCPSRDERTPCAMDSQTCEDTAAQMFQMDRFYNKWIDDNGPGRANPDWRGDPVTLTRRLWKYYGDIRDLEVRWSELTQACMTVTRQCPTMDKFGGFGDWCAPHDGTWSRRANRCNRELTNAAVWFDMLDSTREALAALGKADEAAKYEALIAQERAKFLAHFRKADGTMGDGTQTAYVLPLAFGIVEGEERQDALAKLREAIRKKAGHIDCGIFGAAHIGGVLIDAGEVDLWHEMMVKPTFPGYGYMIARGATTIWEQWDEKGGMNSHNHAMFAGGVSCFYTHLAGIRPAKPGYAEILIKPAYPKKLDALSVTRRTPRGTVRVAWKRVQGRLVLDCQVPPYVKCEIVKGEAE